MSYSLDLHRLPPDDREAAYARLLDEPAPAEASAETQREHLRIAAMMLAIDARFVPFFAPATGRLVEINHPLRVQFSFGPRGIGVGLSGTAGQGEVTWRCLRLLDGLGYAIRDPQLGRFLDVARDFRAVFSREPPAAPPAAVPCEWPSGSAIEHATFGYGAVIVADGVGAGAKLQILFQSGATKRLVASAVKRV
jgi:hypothetical protein